MEAIRSSNSVIELRGESVEECVAFAAACVLDDPICTARAAVVCDPAGWPFVNANPDLTTVIVARPEYLGDEPLRKGLTVVVPTGPGEVPTEPGEHPAHNRYVIGLSRPDVDMFCSALTSLGYTPGEAARQAKACGRSWSVLRRRRAITASLRHPTWLQDDLVSLLATVALVGRWSESDQYSDRKTIERVSGLSYEIVQKKLRMLVKRDESPVLDLHGEWAVRSQFDLLDQIGSLMPDAVLDRFFDELEAMLCERDPTLDLEPADRPAASLHGKRRVCSGVLRSAMSATMAVLGARGDELQGLQERYVSEHTTAIIRRVLERADATRWLSLRDSLCAMAEAAPEQLLDALEADLCKTNPATFALFEETAKGTMMWGRAWHTGLLWALERMAWSPKYLSRAAGALARLCDAVRPGNWANTPQRSLVETFVSWCPQTAASVRTQLIAIDYVLDKHPTAGWKLLKALALDHTGSVSKRIAPILRDWADDAPAQVTVEHRDAMEDGLEQRVLRHGIDDLDRCKEVVWALPRLSCAVARQVIERLIQLAPQVADGDRAQLRDGIRQALCYAPNAGEELSEEEANLFTQMQRVCDVLTPADPVWRSVWLFSSGWVRIPGIDDVEKSRERLMELQRAAVQEILQAGGGPLRMLVESVEQPGLVGALVAEARREDLLVDWLLDCEQEIVVNTPRSRALGGVLAEQARRGDADWLDKACNACLPMPRRQEWLLSLLLLVPPNRDTWGRVDLLLESLQTEYWTRVAGLPWGSGPADWEQYVQRLVAAHRSVTALEAARFKVDELDPALLVAILDGVIAGDESDKRPAQQYEIGRIMERLATWEGFERLKRLHYEFVFYQQLRDWHGYKMEIVDELLRSPNFYVELLSYCFKPDPDACDATAEERPSPAFASCAYTLLTDLHRVPGSSENGVVDGRELNEWITSVRSVASECGHAYHAEIYMGELLANAPSDADGHWPCRVVAAMLEDESRVDLRDGFYMGVVNGRGITSRGMDEGGVQERDLVKKYQTHAEAVDVEYPRLAECLVRIASHYEREAKRHDREVQRRRETE